MMHKLPFPHLQTKSTFPLQLLHSDVWGPAPEISINGFKYYVFFIEDLSKYTWIFPIARKYDVIVIFQKFRPFIENQLTYIPR